MFNLLPSSQTIGSQTTSKTNLLHSVQSSTLTSKEPDGNHKQPIGLLQCFLKAIEDKPCQILRCTHALTTLRTSDNRAYPFLQPHLLLFLLSQKHPQNLTILFSFKENLFFQSFLNLSYYLNTNIILISNFSFQSMAVQKKEKLTKKLTKRAINKKKIKSKKEPLTKKN